MSKPRRSPCRHCAKPLYVHSRGLCKTCWSDLEVRENFPPLMKIIQADDEPTHEEVEAMVAEQLPTMPHEKGWTSFSDVGEPQPKRRPMTCVKRHNGEPLF